MDQRVGMVVVGGVGVMDALIDVHVFKVWDGEPEEICCIDNGDNFPAISYLLTDQLIIDCITFTEKKKESVNYCQVKKRKEKIARSSHLMPPQNCLMSSASVPRSPHHRYTKSPFQGQS